MDDDPFAPSRAYLSWLDALSTPASPAEQEQLTVIDAGKDRAPDLRTQMEASADVPRWLAPSIRIPRKHDPQGRIYTRSSKP